MAADVKGKPTQAEIEEGLKLLSKKREREDKIKRGEIKGATYKKRSEMSETELAKADAAAKRRNARIKLLLEKAAKAGIEVTDKEINAFLAPKTSVK
jgi:polyphosphate kinase 2 (PPK2 family)